MPDGKNTNRHAVDRLADVRAQIRALKITENELRDFVIRSADRAGDEYAAIVREQVSKKLDREKLEKRFGKTAVAECCSENRIVIVQTAPIKRSR